jgi:hypothetical protein
VLRGQKKIAAAALEAAQDYARRTSNDANVQKVLIDLEASVAKG